MAYKIIDMTNINWAYSLNSFGTTGCYFKTRIKEKDGWYYYKLSSYNSAAGFYGHEAINEVIIARLCKKLGIPCTEYKLVKVRVKINGIVYETYACKSRSYKNSREIAVSLEDFYVEYRKQGESLLEFLKRNGMEDFVRHMIIIDYITINRDRHGANVEIIISKGSKRMAPLFDNGLTFVCSITSDMGDYRERLQKFDPFQDLPVNNYIGARSLHYNLNLITYPVTIQALKKSDKQSIFYNMSDVIDRAYIDKIWQIIVYRYKFLIARKLVIIR